MKDPDTGGCRRKPFPNEQNNKAGRENLTSEVNSRSPTQRSEQRPMKKRHKKDGCCRMNKERNNGLSKLELYRKTRKSRQNPTRNAKSIQKNKNLNWTQTMMTSIWRRKKDAQQSGSNFTLSDIIYPIIKKTSKTKQISNRLVTTLNS